MKVFVEVNEGNVYLNEVDDGEELGFAGDRFIIYSPYGYLVSNPDYTDFNKINNMVVDVEGEVGEPVDLRVTSYTVTSIQAKLAI